MQIERVQRHGRPVDVQHHEGLADPLKLEVHHSWEGVTHQLPRQPTHLPPTAPPSHSNSRHAQYAKPIEAERDNNDSRNITSIPAKTLWLACMQMLSNAEEVKTNWC